MKRKLSIGLVAIMGICAAPVLSATKVVDPELQLAEETAEKILFLEDKKEERKGAFVAEYLKGLDDSEDYILVKNSAQGYAIFERNSMELLEYSNNGNSPYGKIDEEIYYAGPTNYYKKTNDKIKNIHTNEIFNKEEAKRMAEQLKEKRKEDKKAKEENQKSQQETEGESIADIFLADPGITGSDIIDADDYKVVANSRKYIEHHRFFTEEPLVNIQNQGNTCMTVATQLLLTYNNWINDTRLIPVESGEEGVNFFEEGRENHIVNPNSLEWKKTSATVDANDSVQTLYEILLKYINPNYTDPKNEGASLEKGYEGVERYLRDYAPATISDIKMNYSPFVTSADVVSKKLISEIDNGRPAIAAIYTFSPKDENEETAEYEKVGHAVVVYGYQNILFNEQSIDGFIAHFGWGENTTNAWFNADWLYGYLTFQTSHQHNDVPWINPHYIQCSSCGRVTITEEHIYNDRYEKIELPLTSDGFMQGDDPVYHLSFCVCGEETKMPHIYMIETYASLSSTMHKKVCKNCGYEGEEEHYWRDGVCMFCRHVYGE